MNDLVLKGTVLSGGPAKGRSAFRIVAGAGGWGRVVPSKPYTNDAGVKLASVIGDAATEVGETFDAGSNSARIGPAWTRQNDQACRLLELLAPGAWYIDEAGVTRLGARAASQLGQGVTHGPVDVARGTVTLAAESIAGILPGLVVDGLEAVDVVHEVSAEHGLRSTIWGEQGGGSRRLAAFRSLLEQIDPHAKFRCPTEYRVVTLEGERLNLQPVKVSTGMPNLPRVLVRPGVSGCRADVALGSRVLVGFVDADPSRPYVSSFEDADGEGFQPTVLDLLAGGSAGGEHVMTTEACALLIYNVLVALMTAAGGGPLLALTLQPLLGSAIAAALIAQAAPAPPTEAAQLILNATLQAGFATGAAPSPTTFAAWDAAFALLATKTANDSGKFPSLGAAAVKTG